ncbi:hypothetical protein BJX66DRAFT_338881 [Aspergillus keveii]|uniref:Kelch repeat protein n=1 Tax=Aspergillus keveii TaxID=714993 RepID=A0ABR4G321_9EURO
MKLLYGLVVLGVIAAVLPGQSHAQRWQNPINISMCTWTAARVNIIRDTVYLHGGALWWQIGYDDGTIRPDSENGEYNGNTIYTLALNTPFDTAPANLSSLFGTTPLASVPQFQSGAMFANDDAFYLYGGLLSPTASQRELPADRAFEYERYPQESSPGQWSPRFSNVSLGNITRYLTHGAGVSIPSEDLAFYVSGLRAADWGPIWRNATATNLSQQVITLDMSSRDEARWSNVTLPQHVPARAGAGAVWVPISRRGIVVLIGGVLQLESIYPEGLTDEQEAESIRASAAFMQTVSVYDIATDEWYNQNTTGDIPPPLTQFCSVYASAPDGSSHNIYIYGGYSGGTPDAEASDNVYVLSLPSFEWILLYSGGGQVDTRSEHACVRHYPDQIDHRVFNLNTAMFQDRYDTVSWSDYQVPVLVSGRIGGNSSGSATRTSPIYWTNTSLRDVFAASYTRPIATWYIDNRATRESSDGDSSGFPGWAGGVIGGILGLFVIAALSMFWLIRRRKHNAAAAAIRLQENSAKKAAPSDGPAELLAPAPGEAGSEPIYEMHDRNHGAAAELPVPDI